MPASPSGGPTPERPSHSGTRSGSANRLRTTLFRDPLWHHDDFVRLWSGRAVSQLGSQISLVAIPLYAVIALNATPFELGMLAAAAGLPRLLLGFIVGAWVDRLRRKPIMITANLGQFLAMIAIPLAALIGQESLALLILVEIAAGVLNIFFQASWVPYLPGLVGRRNLPSANSKILASNSVAQVAGPSLAGSLVGWLGGPVAFVLDALSFLWSAFWINRIGYHEPVPAAPLEDRSLLREMRQGIRVLMVSPLLRALTGSHATIILAGHVFLTVYPLYMLETLHLSATGVGFVYASGGAGALCGSLVTTSMLRRFGTGSTIVWSATLFGVFGLAIPMAVLVPGIALPLVVFAEFAQWATLVVFNIGDGSLQQAVTPDHLLGRVAASSMVLTNGLQPIGALLGGVLGELIGIQSALLIGVAGMFCAGAWVFWSPIRAIGEMPSEPDPHLDEMSMMERTAPAAN